MRIERMNRVYGLAVLIAGAGTGCATTQVGTDRDPRAHFADYKTFAVQSGQVLDNGRVDSRDTLMRDRIDGALTHELRTKGLEPRAQDPDLIVTYTAGSQTYEGIAEDGWGYSGYGFAGDYDVDDYQEGRLKIDVIDARTQKLVWRSVAVADDVNFRSPQFIAKTVNEALKKYPAPRP
jgi:hypothetical protein